MTVGHVVITPVKNEEVFIVDLIDSMLNQTDIPDRWIIVDDFSTDKTAEIVKNAERSHSWIEYHKAKLETSKLRGEKIARLTIQGINLSGDAWQYCSKIDADIVLPRNYFSTIFNQFDNDNKLGICSGNCYFLKNGRPQIERVMPRHTRGGMKTYRFNCYRDIGGIPPVDGWDGIDNSLAISQGWKTRNLNTLLALQQRQTGSSIGQLRSSYHKGRRSYYMGYSIPYTVIKSFYSGLRERNILVSILIFGGYILPQILFKPRYGDRKFRKEIRRQKFNEILTILTRRK